VEKSILHELRPSFKERSNVLFLFLALMSVSDRWMRLVEAEASAARLVGTSPDSSPSSEVDVASARGLLFCLLGMISLSDHFHTLIEGASQPSQPNRNESTISPIWGNLRELLR
jgi:hypothetical protein